MSSGETPKWCTTWSAARVTAAAQLASVVATAAVGVGVTTAVGEGGLGVGADGVWVAAVLVQPVRAAVITVTQANPTRRRCDPPLRPVSVVLCPMRQDLAAAPSLRRFVVDAVGIEEA